MLRALFAASLFAAPAALADEGMWTFDNFPTQKVKEAYGFEATPKWLEHVRLASVRLAGGCSGSFVSSTGLVMTNHHCARGCIDELSTRRRDYIKDGFHAKTLRQEKRCPAVEVNRLVEIEDVTARVHKATGGLTGARFEDALKAVRADLEKACAKDDGFRCDLVRLYQGGQYHLYRYERFQDVRLVFAPEHRIAFFGGDPDNFEFPRYDLDVSFLRVYRDGEPAKIDHFFRWSKDGAKAGQLTFITGNPGRTSRLDTVAALQYARDYAVPERLFQLIELRGRLVQFQERGAEATRISNNLRFSAENAVKALKGRRLALVDEGFMNQLRAREEALRDRVNQDPKLRQAYGRAWDEIEKALEVRRDLRVRLSVLERHAAVGSDLFKIARTLLRGSRELQKPNPQRLPEFADARLRFLTLNLFSPAPIYPDLEELLLTFYLSSLRERLGADDPVVKAVLGDDSPEQVARRAVRGTKLRDPRVRKRLWEGGAARVDASKDPMIALAASFDAAAREVRKRYEDEVASVIKQNQALIAKARFQLYGTSVYPDATFSPRITFGKVEGWMEDGKEVPPLTRMEGTFERATGHPPYQLPPSWLRARGRLEGKTPMNFVSSNDIIGGNSGSPVINQEAEIVGLVFDGNAHSLGGEYGFDPSVNRAVSVHSEAIVEALDEIYGARRLLEELGQAPAGGGGTGGR